MVTLSVQLRLANRPVDFHEAFHHVRILTLRVGPTKTEVGRLGQVDKETNDVIAENRTVPTPHQYGNQVL